MIVRLAACICSGLGSGYAKRAPGTVGSVAAVLFWLLLAWGGFLSVPASRCWLAVAVIVVGTLAARVSLDAEGGEDPQWIVIDEWAGVWIALIGADPFNLVHVLIALVGFRIFDILKPGPVGMAEDLPGEFGIMGDDIVAGLLALAVLVAYRCF